MPSHKQIRLSTIARCSICGHAWEVKSGESVSHCQACNDGKGYGAYTKQQTHSPACDCINRRKKPIPLTRKPQLST